MKQRKFKSTLEPAKEWAVYTDQVHARGVHVLNRDLQDDFGNTYLPFHRQCVSDFGGVVGHFKYPDWFHARYYHLHGH